MEKCKVYKGMDASCKIKGLLSKYFYIFFSTAILISLFVGLSFLSLVQTGDKTSFFMGLFLGLLVLFAIYRFFYKLSNIPKLTNDKATHTITNRNLYVNLNKKNHG